jgi:beta-fructofuranosidase
MKRFYVIVFSIMLACSASAQTPLATWEFEELDGLTTTESVNNLAFFIKNDYPKPLSEHKPGPNGQAIQTNGYATWVEGVWTNAMPSQQLTVSAWLAPEVYPISNAAIFNNLTATSGCFLGLDTYGRLVVGVTTNNVYTEKVSTDRIPLNTWTHIAITVNVMQGKLRGYINGIMVCQQNIAASAINWPSPNKIYIGKHAIPQYSGTYETGVFCGLIDGVNMYNTTLTDAQLVDNYTQNMPIAAPDLSIPPQRFEGDLHRPIYHAIPNANWMNEPHGLVYVDGLFHVFYQKNGNGPYWGMLNWGHMTSPNMVAWTEHPVVLFPDPNSEDQGGCWSGCSIIKDGIPYIMYTGVDGGSAQMCLATANTDVTAYTKYTGNPVVSTPPAPYTGNDFRDPYIWFENDIYYMTIGTGLGGTGNSGGAAILYKSTNLTEWTYVNVLKKGYPQTDNSGVFWELPMFLTFGDKRVFVAQPVPYAGVPARILYYTGSFESEVFTSDSIAPKLLEPGDALLGVTTCKNEFDQLVAIGIIPDMLGQQEQRQNGWANTMSLPRIWSLDETGKTLLQQPLPALKALRGELVEAENITIEAGLTDFVPNMQGRHIEIETLIDPGTAQRVGLIIAQSPDNTERTRIIWDVLLGFVQIERNNSSNNNATPQGNVSVIHNQPAGQPLALHVFLDGSVLEVFINNEKALSTRIYPEDVESVGIDWFAKGGTANIQSMQVWQMKNMLDPSVIVADKTTPISPTESGILSVFPNPAKTEVFFDLNLLHQAQVEIKLLDLAGKTVLIHHFGSIQTGRSQLKMPLTELPQGDYFAQLLLNGQLSDTVKIEIRH